MADGDVEVIGDFYRGQEVFRKRLVQHLERGLVQTSEGPRVRCCRVCKIAFNGPMHGWCDQPVELMTLVEFISIMWCDESDHGLGEDEWVGSSYMPIQVRSDLFTMFARLPHGPGYRIEMQVREDINRDPVVLEALMRMCVADGARKITEELRAHCRKQVHGE